MNTTAPCAICELTSIIDAGIPSTRHLLTSLLDPLAAAPGVLFLRGGRGLHCGTFPLKSIARLITPLNACCIPRELTLGHLVSDEVVRGEGL